MPTNKLWLEHTERAAWESVAALRERLEKAESRLQALAPGLDRVEPLIEALGEAKQKYAIDAQAHDEVVRRLLSRLEQLQAELEIAKTLSRAATAAPRATSFSRFDSEDDDEDDDEEPVSRDAGRARGGGREGFDVAAFSLAVQRYHERQGRCGPAQDLNRLLSLAEDKLDELSELEGTALREAALDLAILAGKIHAASRGT